MNIALWVVQAILAITFLLWGTMLVLRPTDTSHGNWQVNFTVGQRRLFGLLLLLGGLGLVLPAATRILTWLTPLAAIGLVIFMGGVVAAQLIRRWDDRNAVILFVVVFLLSAFVAYGRYLLVPIP